MCLLKGKKKTRFSELHKPVRANSGLHGAGTRRELPYSHGYSEALGDHTRVYRSEERHK